MSFWTDQWLPFIFDAHKLLKPPRGIQLLNPYHQEEVRNACSKFYHKFYHDDEKRHVLMGINPGRLGAGITGISFTDPDKLENYCGIKNKFHKKEELSSKFIYEWIARIGTLDAFYKEYIILSVCPLGFIAEGKNINYYDTPPLKSRSENLIVAQQNFVHNQTEVGPRAFMLGKGQNYKYFKKLNDKHGWYEDVIPLPHPRWVLQYRFKHRYDLMDEMASLINP